MLTCPSNSGVMPLKLLRFIVWVACLPLLLSHGCVSADWSWPALEQDRTFDEAEQGEPTGADPSIVTKGTIGEACWYEGLRKMRVRGYGLVVGLGENGSVECPREARSKVLDALYKKPEFENLRSRQNSVSIESLVDSPDTAVVLVQGEIPAGAVLGSRFDVSVSAVPGTQTTSLRGGRLLPCDARIYRMLTPVAGIAGKSLAKAAGPVLMNPFSDRADAATRSVGRVGTIMGGGKVSRDRRLRLVLYHASYSSARRIASVINARFPGPFKAADAVSPSYVDLTVPESFEHDPGRFLVLVESLYLSMKSGFVALRCRELAKEIKKPGATREAISLAWEAMGKTALTTVATLYEDDDPEVVYYAALAGLRIGDPIAVEIVARYARDVEGSHRLGAIKALSDARDMVRAERPLIALLASSDPTTRAAAYEGLLDRRSPEVRTRWLGQDSFALDIVDSGGEPMIYVKRTHSRRVVLFGLGMRCTPPLFYSHASGDLTLNADEQDDVMTIFHRSARLKLMENPTHTSFDLAELITLLGEEPPKYRGDPKGGLAVDYGSVVQLLQQLCESGAIDARFHMEQASIEELLGPAPPSGRPESDLEYIDDEYDE